MYERLEIFINNRQKILDTLKNHEKNKTCYVSQKQIAKELDISQSRVSQLIKSINSEEEIISKGYKFCTYIVKNYNFSENKLLKKITEIIEGYKKGMNYIEEDENIISKKINCKRSTLQCAKSIIKTGSCFTSKNML